MSAQSSDHGNREGYPSGGRRNNGKELERSVARNECFKCGHPGHWAQDCLSAGDQELHGRVNRFRADSNPGCREVYSTSGRNECFKCGRPGHWARNCPSGGLNNVQPEGQSVYSHGGRSPYWEDDCFKCGSPGHWQRECPSANGGGGNNDAGDGQRREIEVCLGWEQICSPSKLW